MAKKVIGRIKNAIIDATVDAFINWAVIEIKKQVPAILDILSKNAKKAVDSLNGKRGIRKLYKDTCRRAIIIGGTNMVRAVNEALKDLGFKEEMEKYICDYVSTVNISITPASWESYYDMTNEEVINDALSTGINHGVNINKMRIIDNLENAGIASDTIELIMDISKKYVISTADIITGINHGLSRC